MKLLRIERLAWDVLAVCDSRGRSVLDQLVEMGDEGVVLGKRGSRSPESRLLNDMVALLTIHLPRYGPQEVQRNLVKPLDDGILEFRVGTGAGKKGKKLRVLWFYGGPGLTRAVICTAAFFKTDKTDRAALDKARSLRAEYMACQRRGDVEIVSARSS